MIFHAIYACLYVGLTYEAVGNAFGKSLSTIYSWVSKYLKNPQSFLKLKTTKSQQILHKHEEWIVQFVLKFPLSYLHEIQKSFEACYFPILLPSIFQTFIKHHITKKVLEDCAIEIQSDEISQFCFEINQLKPFHAQLLFLDESSFDN